MSAPTADSPGETKEDTNKQRQSNLQRIQQRKQSVRGWPPDKKMEKLAIYSSCKVGVIMQMESRAKLFFTSFKNLKGMTIF